MKRRPPIPTAARSARAGQCASMTPSVYTRLGRGFVGAVLGILVACQPMDTGEGLLPPDEAGAALGLVGVAPSLGPTSGGLSLTLSGTRFRPGMIVTVDGIPSPDVRVTSSTQLTAELPARESGSGAVVLAVKDPSGDTVERADLFRYYYGTVSFRTNYQVGHSMAGFAIADLNKDGSPDLISPYSRSTANISVAMGDGAGYFLPPSTVTALDRPYDVVVRDLNGDGNLDLVSTHQGATDISVLLGNGNGTFRPAVSYPVDTSFGSSLIVRAADVDGDGKLDLVLSDRAQAVINILRGSGDGSFVTGTPIDLRAKVSTIAELSTADLNADGKIDLITANSNENSVALLIGAGGGAFLSPIYASVYQPDTLATADLNGDSKVDVVTSSSDGSVSVLIGNGNGTMKASVRTIIGSDARSVSIADLNADGKPDLVVPSQDTGSLGILFGKGDGTFGPTAAYPAGGVLDRVVVADLNKDARPDLVSIVRERFSDGIRSDGKIRIFYGSSDGTFKSFYDLPAHPVPAAAYANSLAGLVVQDVNSDGRSDVISVARDRMLVSVFLGTPSGELSTPSVIPLGAAPSSVHLSDLDADGRPDIIMTHPSDDTIGFLRAKGPGLFGPYSTLPVSGRPVLVCIADVNGDRIPDLITANSTAMDLAVFHGLEDGGLSLARRTPVGAPPVALACEDLDADGAADIVVSLESIGRIKILYGAYGPAGIGLPGSAEYEMAAVPESIALGDVNHDGRVDMVYSTGFTIGVWLGNGDRTFRNAGSSATGSMANSFIALADINEDRHLDAILLLDTWIDNVKIGLGRGDGSFQSFRSFSAGDSPLATVIADIDRDGRPDLVTANKRSGDITFLRNLSR